MKILVLGSGGREHALVHTFWRQGHAVYAYPGNPGMFSLASHFSSEPLLLGDYPRLAEIVKKVGIDLTVVGSEVHLEGGIQDVFASQGLPLFGPSSKAARFETSKSWAKAFMAKYRIPTASFEVCGSASAARKAAKTLFLQGKRAVVKASGLAGGKGVVCCQSIDEADFAIAQIADEKIYGKAGKELVVEELLFGPEISLQAICDGTRIRTLLPAQDHKRLFDEDQGPNTGGMGAYAPLPFLDATIQEEIERVITQPTLDGLRREGIAYQGVLYFGLMLTSDGPKVLEYNCRFGDPEAQAILPLIETDLAKLMMAAVRGDLGTDPILWKKKSSCCIVLASKGYPQEPLLYEPIGSLPAAEDLLVFHSGTGRDREGRLITAGGRVLGVTGLGSNLEEAASRAYAAVDQIGAPWAHYRRDIGRAALSKAI